MNNKRKRILSPTSRKGEKIMKQPLFKMFMNDSNRKLHLLKHNISNSKDSSITNQIDNNNNDNNKKKIHHKNMHLNLQLFSFKILEAKHNSTPELYLKKTLNILIKRKKCHFVADFNEKIISMSQLRDYLKRYYTYEETKERIPKYVSYYKNYLNFFCRPFFVSYIINKKMVRHMEKVAQIFYNENYAEEEKKDEEEKSKKKKEKNIIIFSKKIMKEIEDGDVYTVVTSELAMKQIQKMNNKVSKKLTNSPKVNHENNVIKNINNIENNINPIQIDEISISDNNYKITPIKGLDGNIEINTNEIISELKNKDLIPQTSNSINLLIEELQSKEMKNESRNNKAESAKEIINNMHNNYIVIKGGKTTNNINININHLTIGQKVSLKKEDQSNKISNEIIPNNKDINTKNKVIKKFRNTNSNTKEQNQNQKSTNENNKEININKEKEKDKEKYKTKACTLTLPPPSHNSISRTNSVINKNFNQNFPKTINSNSLKQKKEIKSPNLLNKIYNGTSTSLHKYISFAKSNSSQNQLGKHTLYTNYSNRLNNIFKNMNYGISKPSKNINIIYQKNVGILTGERKRSISSMKNRQKRIIYSSLHFNGSNLQLLNLKNNIGTSKNSEHRSSSTDKRFIELKTKKDKIPLIKNKEDENKSSKKTLKVKGKHLNLQKLLNVFPKKNKNRVTDN